MKKFKEWSDKNLQGDPVIWAVVFALSIVSILVVYSSIGTLAYKRTVSPEMILIKHTFMVFLGLAAMWLAHKVDYRLAIASMELPDIRLLWSDDARVKKQLKLGHKFVEVSKFPPVPRDISFIVNKNFVPNNYFDLIRELGGDLVEQVELMDKYENDSKFGVDRMSYTYHIVYRSPERTLKSEEVDAIHNKLYEETKRIYNAELR
jgi:hypothetical protein